MGDVAASRDPIQQLGFNYFHVLGSPLFELFSWPRPGTVIVPVGVGALLMRDRAGSCSKVVCPCAKRKEEEGGNNERVFGSTT